MGPTISEVRKAILLALYKHQTGERRHESGRSYLAPGELSALLDRQVDDLYFQRVLRMMLDEGAVELFGNFWVFQISAKGLVEAEGFVHGTHVGSFHPVSLPADAGPVNNSNISIDWAKWGSVASIAAIPVALLIWWFS